MRTTECLEINISFREEAERLHRSRIQIIFSHRTSHHWIHCHVFDFPGCVCHCPWRECVCARGRTRACSFCSAVFKEVRYEALLLCVYTVCCSWCAAAAGASLMVGRGWRFSSPCGSWRWPVNCRNLKTPVLNSTSRQRSSLQLLQGKDVERYGCHGNLDQSPIIYVK